LLLLFVCVCIRAASLWKTENRSEEPDGRKRDAWVLHESRLKTERRLRLAQIFGGEVVEFGARCEALACNAQWWQAVDRPIDSLVMGVLRGVGFPIQNHYHDGD